MPVEINGLSTNHSHNRQKSEAAKGSSASDKLDANKNSEPISQSDTVQLSSEGIGLQKLEEKANSLPDVNMDRVNELKTAIENGTYKPDTENIARKMMDAYLLPKMGVDPDAPESFLYIIIKLYTS